MPIEIRELVVSTEVVDHNKVKPETKAAEEGIKEKELLIEEVVERVFSMLNKKNER